MESERETVILITLTFPSQVNEHIIQARLPQPDRLDLRPVAFQRLFEHGWVDMIIPDDAQVVACQPGALHQWTGFKGGKPGHEHDSYYRPPHSGWNAGS